MNDRDFMVYYKKELYRSKVIMLVGVVFGSLLMICGIARLLLLIFWGE